MLDLLKRVLLKGRRDQGAMSLSCACISNTGRHRVRNEDNFLFFGQLMEQEHQSLDGPLVAHGAPDEPVCLAVFDGMGGALAGEAASYAAAIALQGLCARLEPASDAMAEAFRTMQDAVCAVRMNGRLSSLGTTATVLMARGASAFVGNLGDSPAYLFRDGSLSPLSVAHTDAALLATLGVNRKPGLTQYLGMDESDAPIEPNITSLTLRPHDRILLASDGLTDMVSEEALACAMREEQGMAALASRLCAQALDADGADNVTIIACEAVAHRRSAWKDVADEL